MLSPALKRTYVALVVGAILITAAGGYYTAQEAPPYPERIVDATGAVLADRETVLSGQAVFQKYGLMDVGSVWGHGTYRGPDFTAEVLHRTGVYLRDYLALQHYDRDYAALDPNQRAAIDQATIQEVKQNRYDPGSGTLTLTDGLSEAYRSTIVDVDRAFSQGDAERNLSANLIADGGARRDLGTFFFWTAWAAGTLRPGSDMTYTNNWPPDVSVGNTLAPDAALWTVVSIIAFLVFLAAMTFVFHWYRFFSKDPEETGKARQWAQHPVSASQVKVAKYFAVVVALFGLQTLMGGLLAHYTVHPTQFYGIKWISDLIPYQLAKSWHLQLAVFWISVSWIGMTLYAAPLIGGMEPRRQGLLVDILFGAVVFVAVGALTGIALGVHGKAGEAWFWIGHQGWEYLELGRLWQILLFVGLIIWLGIVVRGMANHMRQTRDRWDLPHFLAYSGVAVVSFFSFGLFYDPRTHLTIADFWRWWVVHTWVEGMFEFFAAASIAFVTVNLGLARKNEALRVAYLTATLAVTTGVIGVGHHYYWFGDPSFWFGLGGVISALEPVPVLLLLAKVWQEMRSLSKAGNEFPYRWPMMFLSASAVWAFLGAGVFGFAITTPFVNYYEHATYLTLNHGHTALFGTYGMLAIGLMLFALRGLTQAHAWKDRLLRLSFIGTNVGLTLMFAGTLLPVGILQFVDSFRNGLWHARSPEFYNLPIVQFFGQIRVVPDSVIILLGVVPLALAVFHAVLHLKPVTVADGDAFPALAEEAPEEVHEEVTVG